MSSELLLLLPEILIVLTLIGILFSEVAYQSESVRLILPTAFAGLGAALIQSLLLIPAIPSRVLDGAFVVDGATLFFRVFAILLAMGTLLSSQFSKELENSRRAEFSVLILSSSLALCAAAGSKNLILAFLAMQLLSVSLQILAGFSKQSLASSEAAIKLLVVSSTSLALFLAGLLLLFAKTGSFQIEEIRTSLEGAQLGVQTGLAIFLLLVFGLAFWMGAFPVQLWSPDVLEGAPTTVSGMIAIAARAMGIAVGARIILGIFASPVSEGGALRWLPAFGLPISDLLAALSGISCLLPAVLALGQTKIKRLVAGLLTVEAGFAMIGILVMDEAGVVAALYSLMVTLFAAAGAFSLVAWADEQHGLRTMDRARGGAALPALEVLAMVVYLMGLVGMPPLPGFLAKFALVGVAVEKEWYGLAAVTIGAGALQIIAGLQLGYVMVSALVQGAGGSAGLALQGVAGATSRASTLATTGARPAARLPLWWLSQLFFVIPLVLLSIFSEPTLNWLRDAVRSTLW